MRWDEIRDEYQYLAMLELSRGAIYAAQNSIEKAIEADMESLRSDFRPIFVRAESSPGAGSNNPTNPTKAPGLPSSLAGLSKHFGL